MSLWTPGGEVPVERGGGSTPTPPPQDADAPGPGQVDLESLSPEERAQAEAMIAQMAQAQAEIADAPADALVANHALGLFELAAIKLNAQPPRVDDARLAIDALAGLVDAVGERLGEGGPQLREALATVQAAWVQVNSATQDGGEAPTG